MNLAELIGKFEEANLDATQRVVAVSEDGYEYDILDIGVNLVDNKVYLSLEEAEEDAV